LNAKKNGDAEAFGCDERTPLLPYAAIEDPRIELHPHFDEAIAPTPVELHPHFDEAIAH